MTKQKLFSSTLASLMIIGQFGWVTVAAADDATPTPTEAVSPSPEASASPSPSPEASASPSPAPSASVAPSASASPSPSPEAKKKKSTDKDENGCTNKVPKWVYDVSGKIWVESDQSSFSCDTVSGYYMSPKYSYDTRIGWYEIMPVGSSAVAQPDYMITPPNVVHTVLGDLQVGSKDYQMAEALGLLAPTAGMVISGTGAGSNNQASVDNSGQSWVDLTNLVNVISTLQSAATSGDTNATSNTQVGDSQTGAAMVVANLINLLASAWSWSNGNLNFFMQNFFGNQTGDLNLNPTQAITGGGGALGSTITGTGADSNNTTSGTNSNELNVNAQNTGNIVNNVDLNAQSGDATASKNTVAGNVATGNAIAQVNIINLINSFINSGSSFFGVLNLFGNLNGDILFPTGFLNGLVPSSAIPSGGPGAGIGTTGAGSNNQIDASTQNAVNLTNTASNTINNNISTTAASGNASLGGNTSAGSAQTGEASTTQGLFNLANTSIFGDNAVLVIVNVLGHWVGQIMTLPGTGTTQSALLTGNATVGVGQTGADSHNQATMSNNNTANINQSSVGTITNNVNVNAKSGDATAEKNTQVGDVSTGDAKATSAVANITNTILNVKHWFGVLVINVFGDWTGDVNNDTVAGNTGVTQNVPGNDTDNRSVTVAAAVPSMGLLALVKPSNVATYRNDATGVGEEATVASAGEGKVLTAAAHNATQTAGATSAKNMSFMFILSALVMLVAGALLSIEKKLRNTK